jgi:alpha,alpha-trehalase
MRANALYFDPVLPDDLGRVTIQLRYRRQILDVDVDHEMLRIASRPFPALAITVAYRGRFRDVAPGDTYEFRLIKPDERDRDENRPTHQAV